jgi:hypothetical protein
VDESLSGLPAPPYRSPDGEYWWDGETWQPYWEDRRRPTHRSDKWCDNCEQFVSPRAPWWPLFYTLILHILTVGAAAFVGLVIGSAWLPRNASGELTFTIIISGLILILVLEVIRPGVHFECPICRSRFTKFGMRAGSPQATSNPHPAWPWPGAEASQPRRVPLPRTRPRRRSRRLGWLVPVLLVEGVAAVVAYGYFNPFPYINPPTTWATPSDAQLQGWQQQVHILRSKTGGFLDTGLFNHTATDGSSFYVGPGHLITALHVVTDFGTNDTRYWDMGAASVTSAYEDAGQDIAALTGGNGAVFAVATEMPARGQHLWLLCPTGVNPAGNPTVSEFTVANQSVTVSVSLASGIQTVRGEIAMTGGAIVEGCSGSPIVDGSGAVVGMADAGSTGCGDTPSPDCQLDAVSSEVFGPWAGVWSPSVPWP